MPFWYAVVKEWDGEFSMTKGKLVVEAEDETEAREKMAEKSKDWPDDTYLGKLVDGPYNSEKEIPQ